MKISNKFWAKASERVVGASINKVSKKSRKFSRSSVDWVSRTSVAAVIVFIIIITSNALRNGRTRTTNALAKMAKIRRHTYVYAKKHYRHLFPLRIARTNTPRIHNNNYQRQNWQKPIVAIALVTKNITQIANLTNQQAISEIMARKCWPGNWHLDKKYDITASYTVTNSELISYLIEQVLMNQQSNKTLLVWR